MPKRVIRNPSNPSKPVILVISPSLNVMGGISTVLKNVYKTKLRCKYEFVFIASHIDGTKAKKLVIAIVGLVRVWIALRHRKIDVVYVHGSDIISCLRKFFFIKLAQFYRRKVVYHLHGASLLEQYSKMPYFIKSKVISVFESADIVICLSSSWSNHIARIAPRANIEVIPNGVALPAFSASERPSSRLSLLFLGLIGHRKGVFDLLKAFEKLVKGNFNCVLLIGGNGDIGSLHEAAERLGISRYVHYLGWITGSKKEEILRISDIFVLPSYGEGMPMSILEAMSYGIPVVSTPVGGIPEVVEDGKTGLLVPPGNVDRLAEALKYLIENEDIRSEFGRAARKKVEAKFTIEKMTERLDQLFTEISHEKTMD